MHVCMYACVQVCMCACVHVCMWLYIVASEGNLTTYDQILLYGITCDVYMYSARLQSHRH